MSSITPQSGSSNGPSVPGGYLLIEAPAKSPTRSTSSNALGSDCDLDCLGDMEAVETSSSNGSEASRPSCNLFDERNGAAKPDDVANGSLVLTKPHATTGANGNPFPYLFAPGDEPESSRSTALVTVPKKEVDTTASPPSPSPSPSSKAERIAKIRARIIKERAEKIETKLNAMKKLVAEGKLFDITFDELREVDKDIKIVAKEKDWVKKSVAFSVMHETVFSRVTTALATLIELKLKIMQTAIDQEKPTDISLSSMTTLATDISKLQFQAKRVKEGAAFLKSFDKLSDIIQMAHIIKATKNIVPPPLMGPEMELNKRAETYSPGAVKNGLLKLNSLFVMHSISGDGHCLFRSTLAHLLEKVLSQTAAERSTLLSKLDAKVAQFNSASLYEKYAFFKKTVQTAVEKGSAYRDIVCNKESSDRLVAFLRELACAYNQHANNDVFDSFLAVAGKSKEHYLTDMMSMQKANYGDHPEIQALCTVLEINICVVDVAEYGKPKAPDQPSQAFRHFRARSEGQMELYLLHRPGHYDLGKLKHKPAAPAAPAEAQVEEPTRSHGTRAFIEYAIEKGWIVVKA